MASLLRLVPYAPAVLLITTGLLAEAAGSRAGPVPPAVELTVERLVVTRGVAGREPVDRAARFRVGEERVGAFVELANPGRIERTLTFVFDPPDHRAPRAIAVQVGPTSRYRTWAFARPREVGTWTVRVRDERGRELARDTFDVTP